MNKRRICLRINKMVNWINKHISISILFIILILFILIPPCINLLVKTESFVFPTFFGFITTENRDVWISFYGAIIGGGFTLFGVILTAIDQNNKRLEDEKKHEKERREDLAIQYKPIIALNGRLDSIEGMYYRDLVFVKSYSCVNNEIPEYILVNEKEENTIKIYFSLKNIGRGCINDSRIVKYSIKNPEFFDNYLLDWNTDTSLGELVPNQEMAIVLNLPGLLRLKNEYLDKKKLETTLNFICEYSDEFNVHLYELNVYFKLEIEIRKTTLESEMEEVSIIAPIYCITQAMPVSKIIK